MCIGIFSLVYLLLIYIKCELYLKSREQRAMLKSPPEGEKNAAQFLCRSPSRLHLPAAS